MKTLTYERDGFVSCENCKIKPRNSEACRDFQKDYKGVKLLTGCKSQVVVDNVNFEKDQKF